MANTEELVAMLGIPESITPDMYPEAVLPTTGNIFLAITTASKAWRRVDVGVSDRIMSVVKEHCKSPEEVDDFLSAITQ